MADFVEIRDMALKMEEREWTEFTDKFLRIPQQKRNEIMQQRVDDSKKRSEVVFQWMKMESGARKTKENFQQLVEIFHHSATKTRSTVAHATEARTEISFHGCQIGALYHDNKGPIEVASVSVEGRKPTPVAASQPEDLCEQSDQSYGTPTEEKDTTMSDSPVVDGGPIPTVSLQSEDIGEERKRTSPGNFDAPSPPAGRYKMNKYKKGRILVISNFEDTLTGYKADVKRLRKFWRKDLKCEVELVRNLKSTELLETVQEFSDESDGSYSICAVFILSHGWEEDSILCIDEKYVSVRKILEPFTNKNNTRLHGIPKLFFFQMCRGGKCDKGVETQAAASPPDAQNKLPSVSDMLVCFASQQGEKAYVEADGSWFIQEMVDVFEKYHGSEHVADMMTMVNERMAERIAKNARKPDIDGAKCMSEYRSTLRWKLYLQ